MIVVGARAGVNRVGGWLVACIRSARAVGNFSISLALGQSVSGGQAVNRDCVVVLSSIALAASHTLIECRAKRASRPCETE